MRKTTGPLLFVLFAALAYGAQPLSRPQESYAPYWTSEPGWTTELQLKNNLVSVPLTVTPALRLASGKEIPLDPTTIAPNASVSVWVNEGLLAHASDLLSQPGSFGSVVFRYTSPSAGNLYANVIISIHGEPISFPMLARSEFAIGKQTSGNSLEGIWWQPRPDLQDELILGNHSDSKVTGTLSLCDASGKQWHQQLVLGSRQTQRMATAHLLKMAGLSGTYGGISFATDASVGSIDAAHFMYDEVSKFSRSEELLRRDPSATLRQYAGPEAKHWTMYAPMLALQHADPTIGIPNEIELQPTLIIRNTTAKKVTADLSLTWRGESGKGQVKLPQLQLAPFATQQYQIASMQSLLQIPDSAHWGLVTLTTDAAPHDLVAIAASLDPSGRYTLETRFTGSIGGHFTGGEWNLDANRNGIFAITNIGSKPTNTLFTLHYDKGKKKYELQQEVAPGDQMWVNLAQLVRNRTADRNGNVLPIDLGPVSYDVRNVRFLSDSTMVSTLGTDTSYGFSARNPYAICCGYNNIAFDPTKFVETLGGLEPINATGDNECTGNPTVLDPSFTTWGSNNTAIAKVTYGQVQGTGAGNTTGFANGLVLQGVGSYCAYKPSAINVPITIMQFNVAYSAYIPVDHISGPSYCYYQGISNDLIYMGDANRGTYRVTESVYTEPDASPAYWGFFPDTGQTRNYGAQSPKNGSTLSSLDEDGVANDCYLWNNSGKASTRPLEKNRKGWATARREVL